MGQIFKEERNCNKKSELPLLEERGFGTSTNSLAESHRAHQGRIRRNKMIKRSSGVHGMKRKEFDARLKDNSDKIEGLNNDLTILKNEILNIKELLAQMQKGSVKEYLSIKKDV